MDQIRQTVTTSSSTLPGNRQARCFQSHEKPPLTSGDTLKHGAPESAAPSFRSPDSAMQCSARASSKHRVSPGKEPLRRMPDPGRLVLVLPRQEHAHERDGRSGAESARRTAFAAASRSPAKRPHWAQHSQEQAVSRCMKKRITCTS